MSTINHMTTIHRHRLLRWSQVRQTVSDWRRRAWTRNELTNLSDKCLQDIGMSRCAADFEASKPFWMV